MNRAKGTSSKGRIGTFKPRVVNFFQQGNIAPLVDEEVHKRREWVDFGHDNLFPERMRALADNCAPLERCATTMALFMAGKGIKFVDEGGNEIEAAKDLFSEWMSETTEEEFLWGVFYDVGLLNAASINVRRSASQVVRLDHFDVSMVRSAKMDEDMEVPGYWWSAKWNECRKDKYKPEFIPKYIGGDGEALSMVYAKAYKQGRLYYSEPWWLGAVAAAEVWSKIDPYNKVSIDTGFAPNVHIHVPSIATDEADIDDLVEAMEDVYHGARGKRAFVTTGNPQVEGDRVEVIPIGNTTDAGNLDELRDAAAGVIYDAYGIPRILVTEQDTGLASQGLAIRQSLEAFQKTQVEPKQKMVRRIITRLMNDEGIPVWDTVIDPLELFSEELDEVLLRQSYIRSVTVDEHREKVLGYDPIGGEDGSKFIISSGSDPAGEPA